MPIYEYECPECGRFEIIQKINADTLTECPRCQEQGKKSSVRKAVSASAFHLKGGGWYKTDYASGSSGSGTSTGTSGTSTDSGSSSSSTSDSASSSDASPKKSCGTGCGCH